MDLLIVFLCIVGLIVLISVFKFNPVISFIIISFAGGLLLRMPVNKISQSIQKGVGDTLGGLVLIISFGAMLGKLIAESGAGQKIAGSLMNKFGKRYIVWSLVLTGFIIGIPLFYGVGFVLVIPLIFSVVYKYKLPAVYIGLPMLAALSVTFGFLPPHPSPTALVLQFHASMGVTLIYGLILSVPAIIIAGPLYAMTLKKMISVPLKTFEPAKVPDHELPSGSNAYLSALLPVLLLMITTLLKFVINDKSVFWNALLFVADPVVVMLISILVAMYLLGLKRGLSVVNIMNTFSESVKDIGMILLIIASAGAFKQILVDSGVGDHIGSALNSLQLPPLMLGWLIAALIRIAVGSATVAGLTTAGIMSPLMQSGNVNPNLMVLSIGAGSLACSHVNDSGFWLFKEYFNLSIKDTFRSWTAMETIISIVGLAGVMLLSYFV